MTIPILKPLRWTHNYKLRKKTMKKLESLETLLFCYSLQTHLTTLHRTLSCRYFLIATVQFLFCCGVGFKKNKMNTLNQHLESRKGLFHHHPAKFTCFGSQKNNWMFWFPMTFPFSDFSGYHGEAIPGVCCWSSLKIPWGAGDFKSTKPIASPIGIWDPKMGAVVDMGMLRICGG